MVSGWLATLRPGREGSLLFAVPSSCAGRERTSASVVASSSSSSFTSTPLPKASRVFSRPSTSSSCITSLLAEFGPASLSSSRVSWAGGAVWRPGDGIGEVLPELSASLDFTEPSAESGRMRTVLKSSSAGFALPCCCTAGPPALVRPLPAPWASDTSIISTAAPSQ